MIYRNTIENKFKHDLFKNLRKKGLIYKRFDILKFAYKAHLKREFYYSIPLFFSQLEGIYLDYLITNKVAKKVKKDYLLINKNGEIIRDRNRNPIKLIGLYKKSEELNKKILPEIYTEEKWVAIQISKRIFEILSKERNEIMHGNNLKYYNCKLSNELLISIYNMINIFDDIND